MISKLDHATDKNAEDIRNVFQVSYAVEAELLNAKDFPPLKRTVDEFLHSDNAFYGCWKNEILTAVIEVKHAVKSTHIQSLVVRPEFFRQGIGRKLVQFVLDSYETKTFTVETGVANDPAIRLYKHFGFIESKQWDTYHGVRKVAFELTR